jgi:hypothetical protein
MGRIQFTKAALAWGARNSTYAISDQGAAGALLSAYNRLIIYKGVPPTHAELQSFINTAIPRASDVLLNYSANLALESFENFKIKLKAFDYLAAAASGEATWFAFVAGDQTARARSIAIGTVSGLGGSGELKISDTNIIAGNSYIVKPMEINLPYKFDF